MSRLADPSQIQRKISEESVTLARRMSDRVINETRDRMKRTHEVIKFQRAKIDAWVRSEL
jgi:hypothetical protein